MSTESELPRIVSGFAEAANAAQRRVWAARDEVDLHSRALGEARMRLNEAEHDHDAATALLLNAWSLLRQELSTGKSPAGALEETRTP